MSSQVLKMQESKYSQRIANLSPAKLELMLRQLGKSKTASANGQPISRRMSTGTTLPPASFAQEGLWFLNQLEPDSPAYNVPLTVRLDGALNIAALERSLSEVVRRHESLRTTFRVESGSLVQIIAPPASLKLPVVDLSGLAEAQREAEATKLAVQDAQRPFDLSREPLIRATILRLSEQEHFAVIAMHHIISDAWSMSLFIQEVAALYEPFAKGVPAVLPEPPIQFADYAFWQREQLQGEALESQLSYWMDQLRNLPSVTELPAGRPRPSTLSDKGTRRFIKLSKELTSALKELSRREGATLFMTLLAAFQVLLHSYTGQEDTERRRQIADSPPDILLTNFMMLELLMTRQDRIDRDVIGNCEGLRFLVLDELHTYRGRQGADVALLVRRVRERLSPKHLQCIGTSATMASEGTQVDKNRLVAQVASKLFAVQIQPRRCPGGVTL